MSGGRRGLPAQRPSHYRFSGREGLPVPAMRLVALLAPVLPAAPVRRRERPALTTIPRGTLSVIVAVGILLAALALVADPLRAALTVSLTSLPVLLAATAGLRFRLTRPGGAESLRSELGGIAYQLPAALC